MSEPAAQSLYHGSIPIVFRQSYYLWSEVSKNLKEVFSYHESYNV